MPPFMMGTGVVQQKDYNLSMRQMHLKVAEHRFRVTALRISSTNLAKIDNWLFT